MNSKRFENTFPLWVNFLGAHLMAGEPELTSRSSVEKFHILKEITAKGPKGFAKHATRIDLHPLSVRPSRLLGDLCG